MSDKWPCEKHILCTKARPCGDCRETKLKAEVERLLEREMDLTEFIAEFVHKGHEMLREDIGDE